jgi:hypothetical protein
VIALEAGSEFDKRRHGRSLETRLPAAILSRRTNELPAEGGRIVVSAKPLFSNRFLNQRPNRRISHRRGLHDGSAVRLLSNKSFYRRQWTKSIVARRGRFR